MKNTFLLLLLLPCFFFYSCNKRYEKISGYWELTFSDSSESSKQILHFEKVKGSLLLTIDEPEDGTLEIPGEKPFFTNDSLNFESMWGLFSYNGEYIQDESVIRGNRYVNNSSPVPFVMRRISERDLVYKIPRMNSNNERILTYSYAVPMLKQDGLECSSLKDSGIDSVTISRLVSDILEGKISTIHSLLLAKDNKLVLEEYFHNYDCNTLHSLESVTKSVTSTLMGMAIDRKLIQGVEEPVWHYLSDFDSTAWVREKYDVRIKHLLTMTAGIDWKSFTPGKANDDMDIYNSPDWIAYLLNKKLVDRPGSRFFYNNRLMFLQGYLLEEASGLSVNNYAKTYLFDELEITNFSWKVYDNGITETGGGLKLLPRDMMKFGLMYLNKGMWHGNQLVSPEWIQAATTRQVGAGNQDYGYNWWIKNYNTNNSSVRVCYALGHGEQTIMIIPELNVVFVMTAGNYFQTPQRLDEIMTEYILPALLYEGSSEGSTYTIPVEEIQGEYKTNGNEIISLKLSDSRLIGTDPSGAEFRLIQTSPGTYRVENSSMEVKFIVDTRGKVVMAEVYENGQRIDVLRR